jgi:hypothetical protein
MPEQNQVEEDENKDNDDCGHGFSGLKGFPSRSVVHPDSKKPMINGIRSVRPASVDAEDEEFSGLGCVGRCGVTEGRKRHPLHPPDRWNLRERGRLSMNGPHGDKIRK